MSGPRASVPSRILDAAVRHLQAAGIDPALLDAQLLMAEAAGVSRATLLAGYAPGDAAIARFEAWVAMRARRVPVAYIIGRKEFYSLDFFVTPEVLIPRPETETAVDAALAALADRPDSRVLDIGTGSGAIAIAIAHNAPAARITAADISSGALEVARHNAAKHGLSDRIEFRVADLFDVRHDGAPLGLFDLIVSNPPYIADDEIASLAPEVRDHEPRIATVAGPDGLAFYRRIAAGARAQLNPGGAIIVEIGAGQSCAVQGIFAQSGFSAASVLNDLAGHPRALTMR
ncbi:MAG: peptide chain release factor N(5)-glutamine methyltransferase [Candidatus Binataceae bacterium]